MQRRLAATARQCLVAMTGGCIAGSTSGWRQRGGDDEPGGQRRKAEAMSGRASERQVTQAARGRELVRWDRET